MSGNRIDDRELEKRLEHARRLLREHHAEVEPDAAFADRVVSRLRREPAELLGWAAWRLLPATLALALALGWLAYGTTAAPATADAGSPAEDPIAWALDLSEDGG